MQRLKRRISIADNFDGSHCLDAFDIGEKTIIRWTESEELGAKYVNATVIETFKECLKYCCVWSYCNVAVWDQEVSQKENFAFAINPNCISFNFFFVSLGGQLLPVRLRLSRGLPLPLRPARVLHDGRDGSGQEDL